MNNLDQELDEIFLKYDKQPGLTYKLLKQDISNLIAQQVKEATVNGLIMAKYGTDEGSKEERFIDNLIRQEQK